MSKGLSDFYYRDLYSNVVELEDNRLKIVSKLQHNILLLILAAIGIIPLTIKFFGGGGFIFYIVLFIFGFSAFKIYSSSYQKFSDEYKNKIIMPLLQNLDKSIKYYSDMVINRSLFIESSLFKQFPDKYSGGNYISSIVSGVKIELSNVDASHIYTNAKGEKIEVSIFKGILIVAEFNKNFNTKTIVLPDFVEKSLGSVVGNFLLSINSGYGELVKLDDPEFEKEFVVYAEDQIESRYILSHSMMKRITNYKKKLDKNVSISFVNNHIFIAIHSYTKMFEPNIFKSLKSFEVANESISTIQNTLGIIKELKLNEKIWKN